MLEFETQNKDGKHLIVVVENIFIKEPDENADNPDDCYGYHEIDYTVFEQDGRTETLDYSDEQIEKEIMEKYWEQEEDAAIMKAALIWEEQHGNGAY